jgi:hypothetical protein
VAKTKIDENLPPNNEVKQYILSQVPDYRHSLFDVQLYFFKRKFISRGSTKKMYHKTFRQLQMVRQQIEIEQKGKFVPIVGENRINLYVFQKNPDNKEVIEVI